MTPEGFLQYGYNAHAEELQGSASRPQKDPTTEEDDSEGFYSIRSRWRVPRQYQLVAHKMTRQLRKTTARAFTV